MQHPHATLTFPSATSPQTGALLLRCGTGNLSISETRFPVPFAFRTRGCQSAALFGILLDLDMDVHGTSDPGTSNATAFACTATYTSAEAELFISVNGSIAEVKVHPSTERSLTSTDFAHEEFQHLLFSEFHSKPLAKLGTRMP
ncbi:uncharacterized protein P174DRAFT_425183 [Aspergillus novofumigatus IBT 16806]|uniref:Uncharacterized protein n=1 Tax=Aspergillus novofumigatus (strain IBT 16806) TaxID=1392255 RepID=A0A2I1BV51_ASPN1|nr:uncharacterized protein P174DRAFT_425183 [Aspergillus novofumigatus IBT 16806]PKX89252.1 hypothetical protein P174DRAFT_425183 [Aspergillus novofumigatus IBT 16806]